MAFLCTGCTVFRGHMDVKERACTGCTVFRGHMDVKERVCLIIRYTMIKLM